MSEEGAQLEALRTISPQCRLHHEGPVQCVVLPDALLITAGGQERMTVVLCPCAFGGYVSRLLLERRVKTTQPLNWQSVSLLGRNWETWSWNNVPATLPWIAIFAEHARCLR